MEESTILSIIIVNWKSADFTRKCLASVSANAKDMRLEIFVIDNASFDGCGEMIQREFPEVRFIQSQENLGFARANNVGFEHSRGGVLMFLNPDTEIVGTALQDMMTCVHSTQDAGVVGAKLLNSDLTIQTSCLQSFPSILNQFLDAEWLRTMFPKSSLWGNRALWEDSLQPVPVEGISGACMMMRRSVFKRAECFSQDYFMYAEDMDLCYKVQKLGRRNYYVGNAVVIHHGGQSSGSQSNNHFSALVMRDSLRTYFRVHRSDLYARLFQSATAIAALCRVLGLAGAIALPLSEQKRRTVSNALAKWSRVLRWALGMEPWVGQLQNRQENKS